MDTCQVTLFCFCLLALALEIRAVVYKRVDNDDDMQKLINRNTEYPGKLFVIVVAKERRSDFSTLFETGALNLAMSDYYNTMAFHVPVDMLSETFKKQLGINFITVYPLFYFEKYGVMLEIYSESILDNIEKRFKAAVKKYEVFTEVEVKAVASWRRQGFKGTEKEAFVDYIFRKRRDFARQRPFYDSTPDPGVPPEPRQSLSSPSQSVSPGKSETSTAPDSSNWWTLPMRDPWVMERIVLALETSSEQAERQARALENILFYLVNKA